MATWVKFQIQKFLYYYFVCIYLGEERGRGLFWECALVVDEATRCVCRGLTATSARSWFSQTINCPRLELSTNQSCLDHCRHPYLFYLPSGRLFTSSFSRVSWFFNSTQLCVWYERWLLSQCSSSLVQVEGYYYPKQQQHSSAIITCTPQQSWYITRLLAYGTLGRGRRD